MLQAADDFPTFFTPADEFPLIIDCGAQHRRIHSRVEVSMANMQNHLLEPDPYALALLQKNVIRMIYLKFNAFARQSVTNQVKGNFLAKSDMEPIRGEIHCDLNGEIERTLTYLWYVAKDWGLI